MEISALAPSVKQNTIAFGKNKSFTAPAENTVTDKYTPSIAFGNASSDETETSEAKEDGFLKRTASKVKDFFVIEDFSIKESTKGAGRGIVSYFRDGNGITRDLMVNIGIGAVIAAGLALTGIGLAAIPTVLIPVLGVTTASFSTVQLAFRIVKGFFNPTAYQKPETEAPPTQD